MKLLEYGSADDEVEDADDRTRRAVPRMIASLIVACFAYIGFAIGGGIGSLASTETSSFSSGKGSQPLYLSLRETARAIVTAERKAVPKNATHDGAAALPVTPLSITMVSPVAVDDRTDAAPKRFSPLRAYLARAPPVAAA